VTHQFTSTPAAVHQLTSRRAPLPTSAWALGTKQLPVRVQGLRICLKKGFRKDKFHKMGGNVDLVTLLHDGELHHILKHIFLPLSPDQLAVCR